MDPERALVIARSLSFSFLVYILNRVPCLSFYFAISLLLDL